jgi:hypothetical protein
MNFFLKKIFILNFVFYSIFVLEGSSDEKNNTINKTKILKLTGVKNGWQEGRV